MTSIRNITKLFSTAPSSINEADKTVVFRISDGKPDRQGEIVDQKSWDFKDYMQNPLLILSHDSSDIENGVGTAEKLWYDATDDATYGLFKIAADASAKAATAWNLIKAGVLRTVSVGFISNEVEYDDNGTPVLKNNQLLETSLVLVPANPRAIALAYKAGEIHEKDARWLMDSMRKEADVLETQLKEGENVEEKSMEDVKSQISALTDAMTKLAEAQAAQITERTEADKAINEKLDNLNTVIEGLKPVEKAAEDDKDIKTDDDAGKDDKVAEKASDESKDDKKTDEDKTDDVKDADKKEEEAKSDEDDAAKGGSDDQSGADADEFNEDAELTPELQAQIDRELAEALPN